MGGGGSPLPLLRPPQRPFPAGGGTGGAARAISSLLPGSVLGPAIGGGRTMRVLVTGATGLIGSALVERLARSSEVFALGRTSGLELEGVDWIRGDLSEPLDPATLPAKVDAVAHLAQSERYRDFPEGALDLFAVNVQSTAALLEYARGAGASAFVL